MSELCQVLLKVLLGTFIEGKVTVTPQNVKIAAKCNTNTKCNNINAKCNKNIDANCNNFPTQNVITFLAQNVITQILITLELQACSA